MWFVVVVELPGIEVVIDTNATDSRGTFPFLAMQTKEVKDIAVSGFSHLCITGGGCHQRGSKWKSRKGEGGRERKEEGNSCRVFAVAFCFVLFWKEVALEKRVTRRRMYSDRIQKR